MMNNDKDSVFYRWSFSGEYIIDRAHNKYHINDIQSLFFQKQLHRSLIGDEYEIQSLKRILEEKIKALNSEIIIQIVNDGECIQEERIKI